MYHNLHIFFKDEFTWIQYNLNLNNNKITYSWLSFKYLLNTPYLKPWCQCANSHPNQFQKLVYAMKSVSAQHFGDRIGTFCMESGKQFTYGHAIARKPLSYVAQVLCLWFLISKTVKHIQRLLPSKCKSREIAIDESYERGLHNCLSKMSSSAKPRVSSWRQGVKNYYCISCASFITDEFYYYFLQHTIVGKLDPFW